MNVGATPSAPRLTTRVVFGLLAVGLLGYLDWITHREVAFAIVAALMAGAVIVFHDEIVGRAGLAPALAQLPTWARPILAALPAVVYFLARGQGTSQAGGVVLLSLGLTIGVVALFGGIIDQRLVGFYRARNQLLPLPARLAFALVVPVLVAFLVIHGSLADLPALFGGTTEHPRSPAGREGAFFLGTMLSAVAAFLLVREGAESAGGSAGALRSPTVWSPTHVVPTGGLPSWSAPDRSAPIVANLDGGLAVRVISTQGDWAQVVAPNGWTGWVDGRQLVPMGR